MDEPQNSDKALLLPVIQEIERRMQLGENVLIVIDGPCGSGKTTLADRLAARYGTTPIRMDDFFLPFDMRTQERLSTPGGNIHHERFLAQVLGGLLQGGVFAYDRFDCAAGKLLPRLYTPGRVTLIEGSYSHHPVFDEAYRQLCALRVFVSVSPAEQLARLQKRDPEKLHAFCTRWMPLEKTYFEAYDIPSRADVRLMSQPWSNPTQKGEAG